MLSNSNKERNKVKNSEYFSERGWRRTVYCINIQTSGLMSKSNLNPNNLNFSLIHQKVWKQNYCFTKMRMLVSVLNLAHLKEWNKYFDLILNNLSYSNRKWTICYDLQMFLQCLPNRVVTQVLISMQMENRDRKQHHITQE